MIISKLQGGLGNQLFQYSAGKALATKHSTELLLDNSIYSTDQLDTKREYLLDHFAITANIASPEEIAALANPARNVLNRLGLPAKQKATHIKEKSLAFDPSILALPDNVYLEGFWQTEKYFQEIADQIRTDFQIKDPISDKNSQIIEEMKASEPIAIHVRRGDYVTNSAAAQFHGTCSPAYYEAGVASLNEKLKNPHIFAFSDDPEWTKDNIKIDIPTTYVSHNGETPWEDLRLMSNCRYFVIANSTFSWWGAWLSPAADKVVIAPKVWFHGGTDSTDLIPEHWVRM